MATSGRALARLLSSLTGLLLLTTASLTSAQDGNRIDYPGLAKKYLEERGFDNATPRTASWDAVLNGDSYARITVGNFDLRFPLDALKNQGQAEKIRDTLMALIEMQKTWYAWRSPEALGTPEVLADWKTLHKWAKSLSPKKLGRLKGGAAGSIYDELKAKDAVRAAAERLRELTRPDEETIEKIGDLSRIVYAPTRRHFIELCAYGGWVDPKAKEALWDDKMAERTSAWSGWTQLVAMENTVMPVDYNNPYQGVTMNEHDKTGMLQTMVERGAILLLRKQFFRHGTHFFEQALGTNLVIAALDENNIFEGEWKLEYRNSGARTQPYTRFVPGGNPSGGVLPARRAGPGAISGSATETSHWRSEKGRAYFIQVLREGQKLGGKAAAKDKKNPLRSDKTAHFELLSLETRGKHVVTAPFLGKPAEGKTLPPDEFLDDYEDFFRAYRSGFLNWLMEHGVEGSEEESMGNFSALLKKHSMRELDAAFDAVVIEIYGVPLSAADGETDNLEWRYLAWLAKKKR